MIRTHAPQALLDAGPHVARTEIVLEPAVPEHGLAIDETAAFAGEEVLRSAAGEMAADQLLRRA